MLPSHLLKAHWINIRQVEIVLVQPIYHIKLPTFLTLRPIHLHSRDSYLFQILPRRISHPKCTIFRSWVILIITIQNILQFWLAPVPQEILHNQLALTIKNYLKDASNIPSFVGIFAWKQGWSMISAWRWGCWIKLIADCPVLFPSKNFGAIVMQGVYYTLASIRQGCLIQT